MKFKDLEGLKPYEKVLVDCGGSERFFLAISPDEKYVITYSDHEYSNSYGEYEIKDWKFKEEKKEIVCFEYDDGLVSLTVKNSSYYQQIVSEHCKQIPCPWEQE